MTENLKFEKEVLQLIVFRLGAEEYTVPIEAVQEIIMPQKTTHIPKSPSFIEGVINLRGKIIPVIDGRKRFDMSTSSDSSETRIIVLEVNSHSLGLLVDAVSEVAYLNSSEIEANSVEFSNSSDFVQGVGKYNDRLLILLDINKFLSQNEIISISYTIKQAENIVNTVERLVT